jgi:hypothetical protein
MRENPTNHNKIRRFSIKMWENPNNYNKERSCSKTTRIQPITTN